VDLLGATFPFSPELLAGAARGGLLSLRATQYSEDIVRLVLQTEGPLGYIVSSGEGYVRISLENPIGAFDPWALPAGDRFASTTTDALALPDVVAVADVFDGPSLLIARQDFADPITFNFSGMDIREVLSTFADFAGRSIVPSAQVEGTVYVDIRNQPWDIALQAILEQHNLAAREVESGIIMVNTMAELADREVVEPVQVRSFRLNFVDAVDLAPSIETLLSDRGQVSVSASANSLVVTDVARVVESVAQLLEGLDLRRPQITISSRIIFIDRTDLEEFGVVYDLKDSRGNQLNQLTPGAIDRDNDGLISEEEEVDIGTNVVSLGGNSIAALGNANSRVVNPSIQFLTSLILGRHTLLSFVEALESVNLSDVQAAPQVTTLDNTDPRD
jgi:type IV pilus assembly protein PilQ